MDQCSQAEVTFQDLEVDERFKKLQLSLKLAQLKNQCNKNVDNKLVSSGATWSNISSIHGDTSNTSYLNSPLNPTMSHVPSVKSEILTSSNNLRNILLKKKHYNTNKKKIMATSSVKQCNVNQDKFDQFVMPPPVGDKICHTNEKNQDRIHMLSNNGKAAATVLDSSVQFSLPNTFSVKNISSCVSADTNIHNPQSYVASTISVNNIQKVNRVFSRWKVMFNNQYELIIKGTLECGKLAHSKPIVRRYTATCIESKFRHKYNLQGNIVDETNELPDYVRDKFYNGFPDDWENVYLIWKTYINQRCPIKFRWPTPIADSDDDLKSEMTDLTYTRVNKDRAISKTKSYRSAERIQSEYSNNKSLNEKNIYNCSANNSQSYEKNVSFAKSFIPNSEDNAAIAQTRNVNLTHDEDNEQNCKSNVNTSCSSTKMNKLIDPGGYLQEDKLNIIINNLMDKNCPQEYIDKIVKIFDCLNYVVSYRPSEYNYDSIVLTNRDTFKLEPIPQQQIIMHDSNRVDTKNIQNRTTELKSYAHSTDPGYESIKNDFIITHQSNPVNIEPEYNDNKDSDRLESEIYAGIPKIPIEQVLRYRERMCTRPARKKMIPQQYAMTLQHNARRVEPHCAVDLPHTESVRITSITNAKETLLSESCTNTLDEATNVERCHKAIVHQRPHETTFFINPEVPKNNIGVHEIAKLPQQQAHLQDVFNVDSDIEVITVDTNTQGASKSTKPNIYLNKDIVINNESNNNVPEETTRKNRQPESEIVMKGSKPIITSSIPVKLNLKINNMSSKLAQSHDSDLIVKEDKQLSNIQSTNEVCAKKSVLPTKSVIIKNDSKMTVDNKKETHPNKKNSTKSTMNPATEQSNNGKLKNHPKVLIAWIPKVVHYAKSTYKLGLIFQGKLLNDAGHVINRNFLTDIILKRLSKTLIETVNHEFYELRGHLNDNKHSIPKRLALQCRNGCPANIKQFCLTWETLQNDNVHDASVNLLKALVSSRGRKIVPPLCYWEGERISMKDDNPVYNPGNLVSFRDNSNEASTPRVKTANTTKKQDNLKKSAVNNKRRIAQRLTYSSTDSEEEKKVSLRKRFRNSRSKIRANDDESLKSRLRK